MAKVIDYSVASPNGDVATWSTSGALVGTSGSLVVPGSFRGRKGAAWRGTYGRRIALWSGASLQNSGGTASLVTTSDLPPRPDAATKVLKLEQNATASFGQQICETSDYATSATIETMGMWVKNPTSASLSCQLMVFNAAANHSTTWNFTVDPCDWTFLTIAPKSNIADTFVWGTDGIHFVRITQRDAGGDAWPAGAYCYFGPVYVGTKARPRFMLCNDDCTSTVYHPLNSLSGVPASGRSFREIVEYYGFKGTLYCIPSLIGTAGYMTQAELLDMQDNGWAIGSHSWTHPAYSNRGLTSLGPVGYADVSDTYHSQATNDDATIYSDVMRGIEGCEALGVWNPSHLFALPQGAWDAYVRSAVMRTGIKHVRAISLYNNYNTVSVGRPTGGGNTGATKYPGGWIHQGDAVQTDGSPSSANIQTYLDYCISSGATGANYHHGMDAANATKLDALCALLRTYVDAGTIDVVTARDAAYDDGLI